MFHVIVRLGLALAIAGCVRGTDHFSTYYLDRYAAGEPTLDKFTECRGFGCARIADVSLSKDEWRQVAAIFHAPARTAQDERKRIARAVAKMRMLVGKKTGTAVHQWTHRDMLIMPNFGDMTQLDCIDEAVNTWTYLTLMERNGLFRFHRVAPLANAGGVTDWYVRNTAVLQDKSGDYFAIDPSLVDAGVPPPVMPLATWLGPWPPDLTVNEAGEQAGR